MGTGAAEMTGAAGRSGGKSDKAFMLLSALGIVFVVDTHLGSPLGLMTGLFPYNSFFMPLFAFVSGAFFSERCLSSWAELGRFAWRKVRRLLLPWLGWIGFYTVFNALGRRLGIWDIGAVSLRDLLYGICTDGSSAAFNDPAWFVPMLFGVTLTYALLRKVLGRRWNDWAAMAALAALGAGAAAVAHSGRCPYILLQPLKIAFFLQFYQLGGLFRRRLEGAFDRLPAPAVLGCAAGVNVALLAVYGEGVEFPLCATMSCFTTGNPILPLLTSVTGIAFWLKIGKLLAPALGNSPALNFLSDHTAFFMTHHLAVKHLFLGLMLLGERAGLAFCQGVDPAQYRLYAWYMYAQRPWSAGCLLFTMAALFGLCRLWEGCKARAAGLVRRPVDVK